MPTYDYKCTNCGYKFELFQRMMDEPIKECPKCKGLVTRLIGAGAGTIFKGTGFYQTDYKNKPGSNSKKEETKTDKKESTDTSKNKSNNKSEKTEKKKE